MGESVIVTIRKNRFCQDVELPGDLPLGELKPKLLELLKHTNAMLFGGWESVLLLHDGKALLDDRLALCDYGILSGFYVDVMEV